MHELVENCHADSDFLVLLSEGKCAQPDVDVGVFPVRLSYLREVSDVGEGLASATLASSDGFLAAHELPLLLFGEHHVHGVLEANLNVLIGLTGAFAEPLLKKLLVHVPVPVSVGFSNPVLHHVAGLHDLFPLVLGACRVGSNGALSSAMAELDVDASFSSLNIILLFIHAFLALEGSVARLAALFS